MPVLYRSLGGELCDFPKPEMKRELAKLITRLFVYFNSKPNDVQLEDMVEDMLTTYQDMGIAEVKLAFQRFRTGYYGMEANKNYSGKVFAINPQAIFDVVKLVYAEGQNYRCDVRETKQKEFKAKELEQITASPLVNHEQIREFRLKLEKRLSDTPSESEKERQTFQQRKEELLQKFEERMKEIGEPLSDLNQQRV